MVMVMMNYCDGDGDGDGDGDSSPIWGDDRLPPALISSISPCHNFTFNATLYLSIFMYAHLTRLFCDLQNKAKIINGCFLGISYLLCKGKTFEIKLRADMFTCYNDILLQCQLNHSVWFVFM